MGQSKRRQQMDMDMSLAFCESLARSQESPRADQFLNKEAQRQTPFCQALKALLEGCVQSKEENGGWLVLAERVFFFFFFSHVFSFCVAGLAASPEFLEWLHPLPWHSTWENVLVACWDSPFQWPSRSPFRVSPFPGLRLYDLASFGVGLRKTRELFFHPEVF